MILHLVYIIGLHDVLFFFKMRLEFEREKNQNWKLLLATEFSKHLRKNIEKEFVCVELV